MAKAKHVLVINDSEEMLHLFEEILHSEAGYRVTIGSFTLSMIKWIKEVNPDLVITDLLHEQEQVGWQLVDKLKMDRETANIPIIVCTGAAEDVKNRERVLAEMNIAVVLKPFDIDELLRVVETKLEESEGREASFR